MMKILNLVVSVLFVFSFYHVNAQLQNYNSRRHDLDQKLMVGLGSWASLNLIGSGVGLANTSNDEHRSFHQMNIIWNTVNLGLAMPGYIKARRSSSELSLFETFSQQQKTEIGFIFNTGLDLVYMSSGLIFKSEGKTNQDKSMMYKGFGNSLIIQGGFLFVFDLIAFGIHRSRSKKELWSLIDKINLSGNGFGIKVEIK